MQQKTTILESSSFKSFEKVTFQYLILWDTFPSACAWRKSQNSQTPYEIFVQTSFRAEPYIQISVSIR